ncbi:MAG: tRNA pseudouridine(38-40) synthase TruA [Candidatus Kapaibacteriales bacterium]
MTKGTKKKIVFLIEYDGSNYSGWQYQVNSTSIQGTIKNSLTEAFGQSFSLVGAGRTDAGVHARGQVAHSILPDGFSVPENKIPNAVNSKLPKDIRIIDAKIVNVPFHATIDAKARIYAYFIHTKPSVFYRNYSYYIPYPLDFLKLFDSASIFIGEWDFACLAKKNPSTKNYTCQIEKSYWEQIDDIRFKYTIQANRFVYSLVRAIVGTMIEIARGRLTPEEVLTALKTGTRKFHIPLAPSCGLFLEKVIYPPTKSFF